MHAAAAVARRSSSLSRRRPSSSVRSSRRRSRRSPRRSPRRNLQSRRIKRLRRSLPPSPRRPNNMGHKVNPVGLRLGINRTWDSRWFAARGEYGKLLHEDRAIRAHILKQQRQAGIAKVVIERPHKKCRGTVDTARPRVRVGKKGADIEKLRGELARLTASEVHLNFVEFRKPDIVATL